MFLLNFLIFVFFYIKKIVILIEKATNETIKNSKLINIDSKVKFNNCEPVEHRLEANLDGSYQVTTTPKKPGNYFISFYKDGHKIEG